MVIIDQNNSNADNNLNLNSDLQRLKPENQTEANRNSSSTSKKVKTVKNTLFYNPRSPPIEKVDISKMLNYNKSNTSIILLIYYRKRSIRG